MKLLIGIVLVALLALTGCMSNQSKKATANVEAAKKEYEAGRIKASEFYLISYNAAKAVDKTQVVVPRYMYERALAYESGKITRAEFDSGLRDMKDSDQFKIEYDEARAINDTVAMKEARDVIDIALAYESGKITRAEFESRYKKARAWPEDEPRTRTRTGTGTNTIAAAGYLINSLAAGLNGQGNSYNYQSPQMNFPQPQFGIASSGSGYRYKSSSGTRYKYDLSNPADRVRYKYDPVSQIRDKYNVRVRVDSNIGQYGGGASR